MRLSVYIFPTFLFLLGCASAVAAASTPANSRKPVAKPTAPAAATPAPANNAPLPVDKHTMEIMAKLKLPNPKQEAATQTALVTFFAALTAWHKTNDPALKPLWADFNASRSTRDDAHSNEALQKIDAVYVSFQPSHNALLSSLRTVLTLEQIELIEDVLTANKVKATHEVYKEIFPQLTADQNAFILQNLKAAREDAINAVTAAEKAGFFKKYKIKIEAYLKAQGYEVTKAYDSYLDKQRTELEAKSAPPPAKPKKN